MVTKTTEGIKVSVKTSYQKDFSKPKNSEYIFSYEIRIDNHSQRTIQLLRREWYIIDGYGSLRKVEGEGVIGNQPVIEPGGFHQYNSGCQLETEQGKMYGNYTMERISDGIEFKVQIPEFQMIAPFKLN